MGPIRLFRTETKIWQAALQSDGDAAIETKGGKVIHLPPKGKYLNPVELLFNDLKNH